MSHPITVKPTKRHIVRYIAQIIGVVGLTLFFVAFCLWSWLRMLTTSIDYLGYVHPTVGVFWSALTGVALVFGVYLIFAEGWPISPWRRLWFGGPTVTHAPFPRSEELNPGTHVTVESKDD